MKIKGRTIDVTKDLEDQKAYKNGNWWSLRETTAEINVEEAAGKEKRIRTPSD